MPLRGFLNGLHRYSLLPGRLKWLYISVSIRQLADSFLLIAGPVFLYELGPRLAFVNQIFPGDQFRTGMLTFLIYWLIARGVHIFLLQPLSQIFRRLGLHGSIVLGQFMRFLMVVVLALTPQNPNLVWLSALLWSFVLSWYYSSYYLYLAEGLDLKKFGKQLGSYETLLSLVVLVAPLVGTLVIHPLGYSNVFWIGAALCFASVICLFPLVNIPLHTVWKWSDFRMSWKNDSFKKQFMGFLGWRWDDFGLTGFWPLFLFLFFHNVVKAGYILTGAAFISIVFVYLAGLTFDHEKSRRYVFASGSSLAVLWLGRLTLATVPFALVFTEALDQIIGGYYYTAFFGHLLQEARLHNPVIYINNRELMLDIMTVVGCLLLIALLVVGWNWSILFISLSLGSLTSMIFVRNVKTRG